MIARTQYLQRSAPPRQIRSKPRRGRVVCRSRKEFASEFGCVVCFSGELVREQEQGSDLQATPTEVAHVGERGLGQKCSDMETLPICSCHHRLNPDSHHTLGVRFWAYHGLDKDSLLAEINALYLQEQGVTVKHPPDVDLEF